MKRPVRAAQGLLVARATDERHLVELGESLSVAIANQINADRLRVGIRR
jgi:hypothetical protein